MESFKYKNKELVFSEITGEVLGSDKFSETHISSSGGGGVIGPQGGVISMPSVESTVINNHEVWIRAEDGTEESINLSGYDVPLRVGQKITLLKCMGENWKSWQYVSLINHSAKKEWSLENRLKIIYGMLFTNDMPGCLSALGILLGLLMVIPSIFMLVTPNGRALLFLIGLGICLLFIPNIMRASSAKKVVAPLNSHIDRLCKNIIKSET